MSASCGTTITTSTRRSWWRSGRSARTSPTPIRLPSCTSPTPTPSSRCCEHQKEPVVFRPEPCDRRLPAHHRGGPQHPLDVDGVCAAALGGHHDGCPGVHQVRRPRMDARRAQRPQGDRIAVRAAAGAHRGRGPASLPRRARRPDRAQQPPRPAGPPRPAAGGRTSPAPSPRCSSTWTGSRRSTTIWVIRPATGSSGCSRSGSAKGPKGPT